MVPTNKEYAAGTFLRTQTNWTYILSSVRRCWLAMPPVAGFLEIVAGVPYNREKNESLICTPPPRTQAQFLIIFLKNVNNF